VIVNDLASPLTNPHRLADPANLVKRAQIDFAPLDVGAHVRLVEDSAAGACVTFVGQVRDHDGGQRVQYLEYSAHPMAQRVLFRIAREVVALHKGIRGVAVSHRIGQLAIGDVALCAVVSAEHRGQAFAACGELVESIKRDLPIWKLQAFADGADQWVGTP
jgi:molybdopterin synthase catalytic subunit